MAIALIFMKFGINSKFLFVLGTIVYIINVIVVFWGRYDEGKGIWINRANKLIRQDLRPAEFLKEYDELTSENNLVVCKPSFEILSMVATAYSSLCDEEKCLMTAEKMISRFPKEKSSCLPNSIWRLFCTPMGKRKKRNTSFLRFKRKKCPWLAAFFVKLFSKATELCYR